MNRREFVQQSVLAATAATMGRALRGVEGLLPPLEASSPADVAVATGRPWSALLGRAVDALDGRSLAVRRSEHVVIKPTLAFNRAPWEGANVHPDVLRAAITFALDGGARTVCLFDRTSLPAHAAYRISHADRVVTSIGDPRVRLVALREEDFVAFRRDRTAAQRDYGDALKPYRVCRYLLEADRVINLATARHHPTRRVSLGMGNLIGVVGGLPVDASRPDRCAAELALLSAAVRPEVTILDATRAIVRNGPAGRGAADVERWNTLVVSRDPVAVEAYGASRFGIDTAALGHIALAESLGLGSAHLSGRLKTVAVP